MTEGDDAALVRASASGDTRSFEHLVAKYQRLLFNIALRMVGDYEDARDITQTTFVKAYENLGTYNPKYKLFSWLYRIMINEALNLIQRRKPSEPLDPHLVSAGKNPEERYEERQLNERVQWAIQQLPPDYREVIILRHYLELSYRDIAHLASIPEKRVKSRLFTARQLLGDILLDRRGAVA